MRPTSALAIASLFACVASATADAEMVIAPSEDVMTSSFFFGPNFVRGYEGDSRPTFRVSTDDAFGAAGAETIYLSFDQQDFDQLNAPIQSAILTVESVDGGFNANATVDTPFIVSAHAVDADPLTSITDDTNPDGPIDWLSFLNNNVLPANDAALTTIDGFGTFEFDVTALVNEWVSGVNSNFAIALTGKNDASGVDFLHGFANNTEAPGSTFLTVTAVPEPSAVVLGVFGWAALILVALRPTKAQRPSR